MASSVAAENVTSLVAQSPAGRWAWRLVCAAARAAAAAAPEPEPSTEAPVLRGKRRQETQMTAGDIETNVFVAENNLRESVRPSRP